MLIAVIGRVICTCRSPVKPVEAPHSVHIGEEFSVSVVVITTVPRPIALLLGLDATDEILVESLQIQSKVGQHRHRGRIG